MATAAILRALAVPAFASPLLAPTSVKSLAQCRHFVAPTGTGPRQAPQRMLCFGESAIKSHPSGPRKPPAISPAMGADFDPFVAPIAAPIPPQTTPQITHC